MMHRIAAGPAAREIVDDDEQPGMNHEERFCCELTSAQNVLLSFVMSLVRDQHLARDIVQETNLVLWRKRKSHLPELGFRPWALRIAYLQTLAALKASRRSRLTFDDDLVERLAFDANVVYENLDERFLQLHECLAKLPERQRDVIQRRYRLSQSVGSIARELGRSASAVGMLLHRARMALLLCLQAGGIEQ